MQGTSYADACPYLGLRDDPGTRFASPHRANHCHTHEPARTVDPAYQGNFCLGGTWVACPLYKRAMREGIIHQPRRDRRRLVLGAAAVLVVVALAVGFSLRLAEAGPAAAFGALADVLRGPPTALAAVTESWPAGATDSPAAAGPASPSITATAPSVGVPADVSTRTSVPLLPAPAGSLPGATGLASASSGVVSRTATRTHAPTATPTVTATSTVTASATATQTPVPSPTLGETPTATQTATVTPTATAPPTATGTPTQTPRPTRRPTATPTPVPRQTYPAPALVAPADGQIFGGDQTVVLTWQSVGALWDDEYYVLEVAYNHEGAVWHDETPWLRETSWELSSHRYLHDLSSDGVYRWSVRVMRRTGVDDAGRPVGEPVSPPSEMRAVVWEAPPGATPVPPPP